ncbi:MAG TPA: hypothetical protein VHL98_19980 [Microvirga sp.]|jgi:hypothetical protein|nr:hypothetical protein [Microvirga sp.]
MLCDAPADRPTGSWTMRARPSHTPSHDRLEARRREIAALLEEIRAPGPADVGEAVREAAGNRHGERLAPIEARISALHEVG